VVCLMVSDQVRDWVQKRLETLHGRPCRWAAACGCAGGVGQWCVKCKWMCSCRLIMGETIGETRNRKQLS